MKDTDIHDHIDALAQEALAYSKDQRRQLLQEACPSKNVLKAVLERIVELEAGEAASSSPDPEASTPSEKQRGGANGSDGGEDESAAPTEPLPGSEWPTVPYRPEAEPSDTGEDEDDSPPPTEPLPGSDWPTVPHRPEEADQPAETVPLGDQPDSASGEETTARDESSEAVPADQENSDRTGIQNPPSTDGAESEPQEPERSETETWEVPRSETVTGDAQDRPSADDGSSSTGSGPSTGLDGHSEQVGAWRLVEPIGRGGMGTVYRAERADGQFHQQAALKLIRHDLGPKAQRRFLSERQILAQLQHPNIAHLLDGGVTDDGRPYFAMEYVDGTPIDTFCNEHELGIEERLQLFQQVCEAVQFAHSNLIVHRDVKPANILVAEPDTETGSAMSSETGTSGFMGSSGPQVKLLDFGIAKALEGAEGIDSYTQTGEGSPLTPSYAAPEQVKGAAITTATDVYAMGVVLCELLTGSLPYDVRGRSPVEVTRIISEQEPERLSELVMDNPDTNVVVASGRSPVALKRRLEGDLDVIVRKALRKEPDRRYASATSFGQDVDRHLEGLPVKARPATTGYRVRRFVERNRTLVLSAAAAVVALLVGLGAAIWQAQVAAAERDRAQQLAEEAQQNAERAEAVQTFLVDMFDQAGPAQTGGEELTVQDLLDDAEAELESQSLQNQPHVRMEVGQSISEIYRQLDRWEPSIEQARKAYETGVEAFGPEDPQTLRAGHTYGTSTLLAGRFERADSVFGALVPRLDKAEAGPELRFDMLSRYGGLLRNLSKLDSAETALQQSLEWYDRMEEPDSSALASTLSRLGRVYRQRREFDEAEQRFQRALEVVDDEAHSTISTITQNLGNVYSVQGRYEEAIEKYRRHLNISQRLYGEESIPVVTAYMSLSDPLAKLGRLQEADSLSAKALTLFREHPNTSNYRLAFVLLARVKVLKALERYEEALPLAEKVRQIFGAIYDDPTNPRIVASHQHLANLRWQMGQTEEAAPHYEKAIKGNRALLDSTGAAMATYMSRLGAIRTQQGRFEEAKELLLEAQSAQEDSVAEAKTRERLSTLYEVWPRSDGE